MSSGRGCLGTAIDTGAQLHRRGVSERTEPQHRVVGGLDAVGDAHRVEYDDVAAMLAFGLDAGDVEAADADGFGAVPRLGWIDGRVAVSRDLDLVVEPNRLRRKAFVEFFDQEVRTLLLRERRRQELFGGPRKQVVAKESRVAGSGDPARR